MISRKKLIKIFAGLGERLSGFGTDVPSANIIAQAGKDNAWFMPGDITMSVGSIRSRMLDRRLLEEWLPAYPEPARQKDIAVIMAGNIPLVGFFDLLCVLISGHSCYFKPSSKDLPLMEYVTGILKEIEPELPLYRYGGEPVDAVIATGSDNTNRYFRSLYGNIPSLLRGSRTSVAVLTGHESTGQLDGLAGDIFSYSGLGCRNVSHLLLPEGYDTAGLAGVLSAYRPVNPKYVNNYRQRSAVLRMQGAEFTDGGFFILRKSGELPSAISEITFQYYNSADEANEWLAFNDTQIQCAVYDSCGITLNHSRRAQFGNTQTPSLTDYPDDADVMAFLLSV